ncbi:MAG TPA: GNAT family N-acetyltransferase [Gemmataceae bacterium]|nr:GNAT family N-acetyltransferase [Gemmataceae bacterium]
MSVAAASVPSVAAGPLRVEVVEDARELTDRIAAWEELAAHAIEANVFYEPWMLLPALEAYGVGGQLLFLCIWGPHSADGSPPLHGFFPLERRGRWRRLPLSTVRLWRHEHCYLCNPLIRRERGAECLLALLRWLRSNLRGAALLEAEYVSADGPFAAMLGEALTRHRRPVFRCESSTRAVWRLRPDGDPRRPAALSPTRRRTLERKQRRLAEAGRVAFAILPPNGDVRRWIDAFLQLEKAGWKGRAGTALACTGADRRFFTTAAVAAFERGRLLAHGLYLDDRPIALRCSFLAGDGSFAFKTAYDEAFSRFSPGVLLELDNLRRLGGQAAARWMDSCTAADNFVINGLWDDRRALGALTASTGRWAGDLLVGLLPSLTRLKRTLFSRRASTAVGNDAPAEEES